MIYMCAGSLESEGGAATADLVEMGRSRFAKDKVNVLVMAGGTGKWWSRMSPETTGIYELRGSTPVQVSEGSQNMGSPDTLAGFLDYGYTNYPADRYALIFWNHGGGPLGGLCWDTLTENSDHLNLMELKEALKNSPFAEKKLFFIGFDACLMSSVETADAVEAYAEYMIASEETEPANGWDYSFLKGIETDEDGAASGKRIIDAYYEHGETDRAPRTMSCIRLDKIRAVELAMNSFFSELGNDIDLSTYSALSNMRQGAKGIGRMRDPQGEFDLVDLQDLILHYQEKSPELAQEVTRAIGEALTYSRSNIEGGHGLSIYHPYYNKKQYTGEWNTDYMDLGFSSGYCRYLTRFARIWLADSLADWKGLGQAVEENQKEFSFRMTEEQRQNFASAQLIVLARIPEFSENTYYQVYTTDEVAVKEDGTLTAFYEGQAMHIIDGDGKITGSSLDYFVSEGKYYIYGCIDGERVSETVRCYFVCSPEKNGNDLSVDELLIYDRDTGRYMRRHGFQEKNYEYVYFPRTFRDYPESEDLPGFDEWKRFDGTDAPGVRISEGWHFRITEDTQDNYERYVAFQITDTQSVSHMTQPLPIENKKQWEIPVQIEQGDTYEYHASVKGTVTELAHMCPLTLELSVTNDSFEPHRYEIAPGRVIINDVHAVTTGENMYARGTESFYEVLPGETETVSLDFSHAQMDRLGRIKKITILMDIITENSTGRDIKTVPLVLTLDELLPGSVGDQELPYDNILAESSVNGVRWQLLSLAEQEDGSLEGLVHLINETGSYQEKAAKKLAAGNVIMDIEGNGLAGTEPGCDIYQYFRTENYYACDFSRQTEMDIPDMLGQAGLEEIDRLIWLWDAQGGGPGGHMVMTLADPIPYRRTAGNSYMPETDLFSEAGVDIKCFGIWTIEEANAVRLSLWIENRSGQDLKISLFNGTAGGRKADIKLPYDRLGKAHSPLYAGTGYYAHADFSPQEGTLDQWRGLPAKLSMMILLEGTGKKIYELEISTFGVMQWDRPVQKLIENERTMSKVSLYADLSSDEPFTCEEVIFPETSPQPKTLMLRVPSDKAQDVSKVTGMVSVDLSEHPEYKEDVDGYLALRPLVYVTMEKSNTGTGSSSDSILYTGKFSDTVLTINRNPDQVVHTVENWPEASLLNGTVFAIPREEFSSLVHGVVPILTITMSADLQERTGRIKVTADEKNQDDEILYFKKLEFDQLLLPRIQTGAEENGLLRVESAGFVWTLTDESEEETLPISLTWIPYSAFEGRPCVEYSVTYKDFTQEKYLEYLDQSSLN